MTQTSLPKVAILATGGTIAGRAGSSLSHEYKAGSATGAELVDAVPELARVAEVQVEQVCNIASSNMVFEVWRALAARIEGNLRTASGTVSSAGGDLLSG